jgi:uncharacterized membrane protein YphA (DoxX/SURF4 family)
MISGRRLRIAQHVLALGFIAGVLLSVPLWLSDRAFPLFPWLAFIPPLPRPLDRIALALALGFAAAIVLGVRVRAAIIALAVLTAVLILADQTRCQPWVYQYVVMLLVAAPASRDAERSHLDALRVMLAASYVWSGLQKLNWNFFADISPWLLEPIARRLPMVAWGAHALPVVEILIGVGLLLPGRLRRVACWLGTAMHVLILFILGPLGHDINSVVWPWNVVMIALIWVLFGSGERLRLRALWLHPPALARRVAVLAFALLPALNFVGVAGGYLSWSLYAGMMVDMAIDIAPEALPCLPEAIRQRSDAANNEPISIGEWAMDVLNVPPYPERWVQRRLRDQLCPCDPEADLLSFVIWHPRRWRQTTMEMRGCDERW